MVQHATVPGTHQTEQIVEYMLESGRYSNEQEVILAGLRLLMDYIERLENLEREIQKGVDSGPAVEIDLETFLAERHAENGLR
jgi:antitoxin ParD1/3/4